VIPETTQGSSSAERIPDWIRNVANFWSKSQITDTEFPNEDYTPNVKKKIDKLLQNVMNNF